MTKRLLSREASSRKPLPPDRRKARKTLRLTLLDVLIAFALVYVYFSPLAVSILRGTSLSSSGRSRTSSPKPTMTRLTDWEDVSSDSKSQGCDTPKTSTYKGSSNADPCPAYQEVEDYDGVFSYRPGQRPRLVIIGATWGGVSVTDDVRAMAESDDSITLDMFNLHELLTPDPAFGVVKTLTVLFQFEGTKTDVGPQLLNIPEYTTVLRMWADANSTEQKPVEEMSEFAHSISRPWRTGLPYNGSVEILAALYGPERIETPSVLQELTKFFEGRRGQIRMTNEFWKKDTWPGVKKSWTVYFRFTDSRRIQVVTGMEDGALEVPWGRF